MRPQSIAEVAELTRAGEHFDICVRNFLDEFKENPILASLEAEPLRLKDLFEKGALYDAYLAAVAESLSTEYEIPTPAWAWAEDRKLRRPWFALPWAGMRAILLLESPAAFRSRNLFVSANALSRA
jgi:hypothetical protein